MTTKEQFENLRKERGDLATLQQRAAANPQKSNQSNRAELTNGFGSAPIYKGEHLLWLLRLSTFIPPMARTLMS